MSARAKTRSWLTRHRRDRQVRAAAAAGWRSRAACKLAEIDDRKRIVRGAHSIVDLGCAPGGWLQVAVERAKAGALIVGVDLLRMQPVAGAHFVQGDLGSKAVAGQLAKLAGSKIDVLLCDAAPNLSGVRDRDRALCALLHEQALGLAAALGAKAALLKSFAGEALAQARELAARRYAHTEVLRLDATRKHSGELYLIAKRPLHTYNLKMDTIAAGARL